MPRFDWSIHSYIQRDLNRGASQRVLFRIGAVAVSLASCTPPLSYDSGSGGAGGQAGAEVGGAGGFTGAGGFNGAGSGQPSVDGQGGGPYCEEDPCKLVAPQCGCKSGENCTLDAAGDRTCGPSGTAAFYAECGIGDCVEGAICLGEASVGYCVPFCAADTDCEGTNICASRLADGNGEVIPNVSLCSSTCNLATSVGCPDGLGCKWFREEAGAERFFTACFEAGNATSGSCANNPGVCAPGYDCYNDGIGDKCFQNCDVASPVCNTGTCVPIQDELMQQVTVNGFSIGACL